jgi:energy-coupling factor transport system ATP-binding protein
MTIFKMENLTYTYPENINPAVKEVNMQIGDGEFILLVGTSGCGKSTLLRLFAGLAPS